MGNYFFYPSESDDYYEQQKLNNNNKYILNISNDINTNTYINVNEEEEKNEIELTINNLEQKEQKEIDIEMKQKEEFIINEIKKVELLEYIRTYDKSTLKKCDMKIQNIDNNSVLLNNIINVKNNLKPKKLYYYKGPEDNLSEFQIQLNDKIKELNINKN